MCIQVLQQRWADEFCYTSKPEASIGFYIVDIVWGQKGLLLPLFYEVRL